MYAVYIFGAVFIRVHSHHLITDMCSYELLFASLYMQSQVEACFFSGKERMRERKREREREREIERERETERETEKEKEKERESNKGRRPHKWMRQFIAVECIECCQMQTSITCFYLAIGGNMLVPGTDQ
jgi:hypothetical protein